MSCRFLHTNEFNLIDKTINWTKHLNYMDNFLSGIEKAKKELNIVDHMTGITMSLIENKNLIFSNLNRINNAITLTINWFLKEEVNKGKIKILPSDESFRREYFCRNYEKLLDANLKKMIVDLPELASVNKEMERIIERDGRFILIYPNFSTKVLGKEQIKEYVNLAKQFVKKMEQLN